MFFEIGQELYYALKYQWIMKAPLIISLGLFQEKIFVLWNI